MFRFGIFFSFFFFSSRRRHTRWPRDWSSDVQTCALPICLLGHAGEMVKASGVGIAIGAPRLPLLPGTRELAEAGHWSGGMRSEERRVGKECRCGGGAGR